VGADHHARPAVKSANWTSEGQKFRPPDRTGSAHGLELVAPAGARTEDDYLQGREGEGFKRGTKVRRWRKMYTSRRKRKSGADEGA
jgi:hypothetical protein